MVHPVFFCPLAVEGMWKSLGKQKGSAVGQKRTFLSMNMILT